MAIVNEKAAKALWPGQNPIGQKVQFAGDRRVVGVKVANVRHLVLEQEGGLEGYIPMAQAGSATVDLVIRSTLSQEALVAGVRKALQSVEPTLATEEFQQLGELVDRALLCVAS